MPFVELLFCKYMFVLPVNLELAKMSIFNFFVFFILVIALIIFLIINLFSKNKKPLRDFFDKIQDDFSLDYLRVFSFIPGVLDDALNAKHQKRIEQLEEDNWFKELLWDYRYGYIIRNNLEVKRYLSKPENMQLLKIDEQIKKDFIELVKREHLKFCGLS